jgi:preprotein translocase subunit SecA
VLKYDDVMKRQREFVYGLRRDLLEGDNPQNEILEMAGNVLEELIRKSCDQEGEGDWDFNKLFMGAYQHFGIDRMPDVDLRGPLSDQQEMLYEALYEKVKERFEQRREMLASRDPRGEEGFFEACRLFMLQVIDKNWKEHLLNMDNLRDHIGLRGYAQADPLVEYNKEAFNFFESMFQTIDSEVCMGVFTYEPARPHAPAPRRRPMPAAAAASASAGEKARKQGSGGPPVQTVKRKSRKVKPNDPCPCGSGKKFKKCCGKV